MLRVASILVLMGAFMSLGPVLAAVLPGHEFVPVDSNPRLKELHKESVKIRTWYGTGGGTILEGGILILTAAHVFVADGGSRVLDDKRNARAIKIEDSKGNVTYSVPEVYVPACNRTYQVNYVWPFTFDPKRELDRDPALVRLKTRVCTAVRGLPYQVTYGDGRDDLVGVKVHSVGWVRSDHPDIVHKSPVAGGRFDLLHVCGSGVVEHVQWYPAKDSVEITHTAPADKGVSGGGLLVEQGQNRFLLGVSTSGNPEASYAAGISRYVESMIKEAQTTERSTSVRAALPDRIPLSR